MSIRHATTTQHGDRVGLVDFRLLFRLFQGTADDLGL
jgi:hypothetical protein